MLPSEGTIKATFEATLPMLPYLLPSGRTEEATFEATYFYPKTYIFDFLSGLYENVTDLLDLRKQKLRNGLRGNHILWPSNQGKEL